MEFNKVFLMGNLTRDPESRAVGQSTVCKLGLAANRRYTANGEKKEEVLFADVETWSKTAELCQQYLRKGAQVLVEGRLKMEKWEKEGKTYTKLVIVADRVQFGAKPKDGEGAAPAGSEAHQPAQEGEPVNNDDLPF